MRGWLKPPCGCYAERISEGHAVITAEAFLCEAHHKQGQHTQYVQPTVDEVGRPAKGKAD